MRRLLATALLSLAILAAVAAPVSAWGNFSFGIGVSGCWQSGDNSLGCGFWNNGAYPSPGYPSGYYPLGYPAGPHALNHAFGPRAPYVDPSTSPYGAYSGYACPPFGGSPELPVFFGWTPQTDYIVRD